MKLTCGLAVAVLVATSSAVAPPPPPSLVRVVVLDDLRVSVLSSAVLRIETATDFTDLPTVTFPSRNALPVPPYTATKIAGAWPFVLETTDVRLKYNPTGEPFGCGRLVLELRAPTGVGDSFYCVGQWPRACAAGGDGGRHCPGSTFDGGAAPVRKAESPLWPGQNLDEFRDIVRGPPGNLNGSVSSTDCYHGNDDCVQVYEARMQPGLFSREGWRCASLVAPAPPLLRGACL